MAYISILQSETLQSSRFFLICAAPGTSDAELVTAVLCLVRFLGIASLSINFVNRSEVLKY